MTNMVLSTYTKPVYSPDNYGFALAVSVAGHLLLMVLLFLGWNHRTAITELDTPKYVQAHLVKMTAQGAIARPEPAKAIVEKPAKKAEPEPEIIRPLQREPDREVVERQNQLKQQKLKQEKLKQEKVKQEKIKQQKLLEENQKREAMEKAAKEKAAAEKRQADQALAREMAEEDALQQSLSDKELAESYADRIRRRVEQNWSRPPSAQKGMEVLLEIQLVPTGYVTGVSVLRSSGNSAFDLSATQAVHKADHFPEIKDVPSRAFEQHFRRFQMLFRVEDDF
jgi:colicin import membrane protein